MANGYRRTPYCLIEEWGTDRIGCEGGTSLTTRPDRHQIVQSTSAPASAERRTRRHPHPMGCLLDLPFELHELIVGHLRDDRASLSAFSLVSRALLSPSQAQLFKRINIWRVPVHDDGNSGNTEKKRKQASLDLSGTEVLSYTGTLSISMGRPLVYPQHLDHIFDDLVAFREVRELRISLFATHYVRHPLTSPARYFTHFQPTLRSLYLETWSQNPWDLITFIAFFPLLEDLTIEIPSAYNLPTLPKSEPVEREPVAFSPFRGSLRLRQFHQTNLFVLELLNYPVHYHTLAFHEVTIWTGIRDLIVACAPTLQVLDFFSICEYPAPQPNVCGLLCLVLWNYRRAESILGFLAEPLPVRGVNGDQRVSHRSRKLVGDETLPLTLIDDILAPPSKDHPHLQCQPFCQEEQTRRKNAGSQQLGDDRRSVSTVSREESGGCRGCHTALGDEASEFGAGVQMVYVAI